MDVIIPPDIESLDVLCEVGGFEMQEREPRAGVSVGYEDCGICVGCKRCSMSETLEKQPREFDIRLVRNGERILGLLRRDESNYLGYEFDWECLWIPLPSF